MIQLIHDTTTCYMIQHDTIYSVLIHAVDNINVTPPKKVKKSLNRVNFFCFKSVDLGIENPKFYTDFKMRHFTFVACSYQKPRDL
jgi:hypothetical protein